MPSSQKSAACRVAVVGTLNLDLVWLVPALPRPGQTILADAVRREFGGKGANQAVAAARQGARVTLVGAVGDDAEGGLYREHLRREHIDVTRIATAPGVATGTAHVYVDPQGENLIVVDRGANQRLDVPTVTAALDAVLPATDVLVVQLEGPLETTVETLRRAAQRGIRSVLNASPTHAGFPWGELEIDTVIVNEHECRESFAHPPAALHALPCSARQHLLQERRVRHLIVTQGSEPTLHFAADGEAHAVPTFAVEPRDTVGAGDTFAGVLAARLAEGEAWEEAIWHANVAAALATLEVGAQKAMPTRSAVEAALAGYAGCAQRGSP